MGVRKKINKNRLKFNHLTDENKKHIEKLYFDKTKPFDQRIKNIMSYGKWSNRYARLVTSKLGLTEPTIVEPEEYTKAKKRKHKKTAKRFIITWAQNNTPVHDAFFDNLKAYSKHIGAEIHVILGRYKNPTSVFSDSKEEFWDKKVLPYADANRHDLHANLSVLSDIKIQPTATYPLSGMESLSGLSSAVFGHPKMQMDTIPALEGYEPKMLFTTGACTIQNYTDSKAGKKSEFHHVFGAVIVEIKDKNTFFIRQITATETGSFCDLYYSVNNKKVTKTKGIEFMVLGDKHINQACPIVDKQQRVILDALKPKKTLVHDIFDGESCNHHMDNDPIQKYILQQTGGGIIKNEIETMMRWIETMRKYNLVIVSSNHNDWLDRYIKGKDWKKDIVNAMEYMEYARILLSGKAKKGIIAYLIEERFGKDVVTLGRNDSYRLSGWELASHGDKGANGSRGGLVQFSKLSTKMVVGDSHVPRRAFGVMYVGTSTKLRIGYNIGASSWRNADVICHLDGKCQQIFYMGDKKEFTTFKL